MIKLGLFIALYCLLLHANREVKAFVRDIREHGGMSTWVLVVALAAHAIGIWAVCQVYP